MAEFGGHGDDQPHVGDGYAVQRVLVVVFFPEQRQPMLLVTFKVGSLHCRADHDPSCRVFHH